MARQRMRGTPPPDALDPMQRMDLEAWCQSRPAHRWALKRLDEIIEECFDHFRSTGELGHDWVATVRNWIRRAPQWNPQLNAQPMARSEWKPEPQGEAVDLSVFREGRKRAGV